MSKPKSISRDAKIKREGSNRQDRAMEDRVISEDRELSDSERLDALRMQSLQSHLPDLPKIPGYHVCWLTTTNSRDPIFNRVKLGYEPIRPEDVPSFPADLVTLKSGEWAGCIGVNEMIAFKLPLHLYEMYMKELHHEQPKAEEEKIQESARAAQEKAAQAGQPGALLMEESGTATLGVGTPPAPNFGSAYGEK